MMGAFVTESGLTWLGLAACLVIVVLVQALYDWLHDRNPWNRIRK